MDPAGYCVYNVTRNALLSERVVSVSNSQTPSQLLAVVLNGPGRDPHFCIRLTNVSVAPEIPRLFAFDVAYLDAEQRIVEVADVGPGTPFPPITDQVASILFLSDQLLGRSGTEAGDFIRICTEAELAALLRAAAHFQQLESPGSPIESPGPSIQPDPFAGSLIFLPVSGTPQTTEVFLATQPTRLDTPDPFAERVADPSSSDLSATTTEISEELSNLAIDDFQSTPEPQIQELEQPGLAALPTQPLTRFFETAFQQPPPLDTTQDKKEDRPASQSSQIPFSLKAVIQFVDDQLRREKREQEERSHPEELPQPKTEAARPQIADTIEEPAIAEPASAMDEPLEVPVAPETAGLAPDLSIEDMEWSRFHATPIDEPEHEQEPIPLPQFTSEELQSPPVPQFQPSVQFEQAQTHELVEEPSLQTSVSLPERPVRPREPLPPPPVDSRPLHAPEPLSHPAEESLPAIEEPAAEAGRSIAARTKGKLPFATRVQRWLAGESVSLSGNRRRGERIAMPGLVAFYFTGGAPKPHEIVNISSSGLYLRSKELWSPNTLVRMTLERRTTESDERKSISVLARVVRVDDGGIGHEFVTTEVLANLRAREFLPQQGTNRKELEKFLSQPR